MKNLKSYILMAAALIGFSSCQDSFDEPTAGDIVPVASLKANTTIAEVKELMWKTEDNYCDLVPMKDSVSGEHIVISGRVVSSDYAGNCFKYIILQDETGALTFSINSYNLYLNYRRGQEIVVDLTGLHVGKYRGLEQAGFPAFNSSVNGDETSFMSPERFKNHVELNGMPDLAQVDTIQVNSFSEIGSTPADVRRWQSQLVRFNNVEFVPNSTIPTFSTYHSSGVTQQIADAEGNTMDVRTSGYSNFWNQTLPVGKCDVVAIMGYYINLAGSGGWQLTLIDANAVMNLGNPSVPQGSQSNPYDVLQAVAHQVNGGNVSGWVKGYIVGTVAPEIEEVKSNSDIEWTATPTLGNTLVIGQTPETKNIAECLVVALPQGSDLRNYGALRENPGNYGKEINIKGTFAKVMGTYGITGNRGTASEFSIEGMEPVGPVAGDGSEGKPYNVNQVLAKGADASEIGVYLKGYIVGFIPDKTFSEAIFSANGASTTNIILAASASETDVNKCVPIQLPSGAVRSGLNLADNPGNYGAEVTLYGDIAKYFGVAGFKNTSSYVLGAGGGPSTPDTPSVDPVTSLDESFATEIPATWKQVNVAGDKSWYWREFDGVGYATMTGYKGTAPFDQWLVSPAVDMSKVSDKSLSFRTQVNGYGSTTSKFEVYVMTTADTKGTNTKLNPTIAVAPASGYSNWVESGKLDLSAYSGIVYIGFRYSATQDANYATWCVTDVKLGTGSGSVTPDEPENPDTPVVPSGEYKGDFNSFNGGEPAVSYSEYTNATGWVAKNCAILAGLDSGEDSNPHFTFIGSSETLAPTLNGKVSAPGSLTSPVLSGGCGKLSFNYGFPFSDKDGGSVKIEIIQDGKTVKEDVIDVTSKTYVQKKAFSYSLDVNVSGNFQIKITNLSVGQQTSNKERMSIWNLTWTE